MIYPFCPGRLLRNAQPELMDTLIQASKDGDESKLHALLSEGTLLVEEEEVEDLPDEQEVAFLVNITRMMNEDLANTELTIQHFNRTIKSISKLQIDGLMASFAKTFQLLMKFTLSIVLNLIVRYCLHLHLIFDLKI
jgi:hypothetical protein